MIAIGLFCMWFSWKVADMCEPWSLGWWLNVFASALNAVIVVNQLLA